MLDLHPTRITDKDGAKLITYNHANRRTTYTKDAELRATYVYNARGQRTLKIRHKTEGDKPKHFHYDQDGTWLGDYTINLSASTDYFDYVWLNHTPLVRLKRSFKADGTFKSDKTTWLHVDHLNTPRIGTDDGQTIVWRWDSDPFGREGISSLINQPANPCGMRSMAEKPIDAAAFASLCRELTALPTCFTSACDSCGNLVCVDALAD